jgi:hypothetical protein
MTLIEQEFNKIYEQSNDEYQKIADDFHQISNLFEKYFRRPNGTEIFGDEAEVNDSDMESEIQSKLAASCYNPKKRMRESRAVDELLERIQILIFTGEHNVPSLIQRIQNYRNRHYRKLVDKDIANRYTQKIVESIRRILQDYRSAIFDNVNEKVYVNHVLTYLWDQSKELNNMLFDHKENPQQPQPLYTIFTDRTGKYLNLAVIEDIDTFPDL